MNWNAMRVGGLVCVVGLSPMLHDEAGKVPEHTHAETPAVAPPEPNYAAYPNAVFAHAQPATGTGSAHAASVHVAL